ncbi:protein FAR-RED IMPAIRED RESPONSE 1-like [Silene latifolia]|uniref:protein FAR-RED IMPAIRED RESPONSE 1-like n=1 Tax=Silene latifolia TaxID=37657 RepID=UPI003D77E66A
MSDNNVNNDQASNEFAGDYYDDFGSNGVDYTEHFITNRVFTSSKEGFNWAYQIALGHGFGIKRASNKRRGQKTDLRVDYFVCRRGGRRPNNDDGGALMRANTTFQWCDCKFKMKIVEVQAAPPQWLLYMRFGVHNHALVKYGDSDRYYAKLDDDELAFIDAQVRAHIPPTLISAGLHKRNQEKPRPARRQIYNRAQKVRADEREGRNPAQQMLALAVQHRYVHFWVTDQSTNQLTHMFMAHPEAVKMFRSYYYVVIMVSTYKTNKHGLPLVEMVGVTPVGKTFLIAYAFVKYESEDGYAWALRHLKALLNDDVQPNVIVTDFERGLTKAIPNVFPNSSHLLCLWHIYAAVEAIVLDVVTRDSNWAIFISSRLFGVVVQAGTRAEFDVAWEKLAKQWPPVAAYIHSTWFPHVEKWAKYRTNKLTHFGNTSTSRVESAHAILKKWLNSAKLALDSIWVRFHSLMETQHVEIRHLLELSRSKRLTRLVGLFSRLACKLFKNSLVSLREEFQRGA